MCLSPLKIRNPTKKINPTGGQQLLLSVGCGHCAECITLKRNEWYFRTYYQVQDTLKNGGYIYFDTLTYRDSDLPHLSSVTGMDFSSVGVKDFVCFDFTHIRNFFKNLRRQLSYKYGKVDFKYFVTSEYGTDDRYTHRPHYHVMFYVYSKIHPFVFSEYVSKCWPYGRTDGIRYHSNKYISEHTYGYDLGFGINTDFKIISSLCMYVSKYVTKDSTFTKTLNKRKRLLSQVVDDDEVIKELFRSIDMFHRQSQGFGLGYLSTLQESDIDAFALDSMVRMPDTKKVVMSIPLPMYYKRKLFYRTVKTDDDTRAWVLNERGQEYMKKRLLANVDTTFDRYNGIYINMPHESKSYVNKLLNGRTLKDFVSYKVLYKGRVRANNNYSGYQNFNKFMINEEYNLLRWLPNIIKSCLCQCNDFFTFGVEDKHVKIPRIRQLSFFDTDLECDVYTLDSFINQFCFHERSDYWFYDFDKLDAYFDSYSTYNNDIKQQTFDYKEDLKKRLKIIGYV